MYKTELKSTHIFLLEMLKHSSIQWRSFTLWAVSQKKASPMCRAWRDPFTINIQLQVSHTRIWEMVSTNE